MKVSFYVHFFKFCTENVGSLLTFVMRNTDASHHKTTVLKFIAKAKNVHIVSNAQIAANFVLFNINCADYNYDFCTVCKLHKHSKLAVRLKTRKYAGCMKIIEKFSAEFKIQLIAELTDTFFYVFRLNFQIFVVVKTIFHNRG